MLFNTHIAAITIPTLDLQMPVFNSEWKEDGSFYANDFHIRINHDTMWVYTKDSFTEYRITSMKYDFQMQVLSLDGYVCDNQEPVELEEEEETIFTKVPEETFYILLDSVKQREEKGVVAWGKDLVELKEFMSDEEYQSFCKTFVEDYYKDDDGETLHELGILIEGRLKEEKENHLLLEANEFLRNFIETSLEELREEGTNLTASVISLVNFFIENHEDLTKAYADEWDELVFTLDRKLDNPALKKLLVGVYINY